MPKTGPCRTNQYLHDPLVMTLVKCGHVPEWISACAGKFTSRTGLPSEEKRSGDSDRLICDRSARGFAPCFSVPTAPGACSSALASPAHLHCNLTGAARSLRDLQGHSTCLLSMCRKNMGVYLKWEKVGAFSWGRKRGTPQRAAATLGSV